MERNKLNVWVADNIVPLINSSKNGLATNMQILQVIFLQEKYLQDLDISCKTVLLGAFSSSIFGREEGSGKRPI